MNLITKKITEEENRVMIVAPTEDEIKQMVKGLPKEKSLGIDGVTIEILTKFWPKMKEACMAMI